MRLFACLILVFTLSTRLTHAQDGIDEVPTEVVDELIEQVLSAPEPQTATPLLSGRTRLERLSVSGVLISRRQRVRDVVLTALELGEDNLEDLLMSLGPKTRASLAPAIIKWLKHPNEKRRAQAASTLFYFDGVPDVVVPQLRELTGDSSHAIRRQACRILSWVQPPPIAAREDIGRLLNDVSTKVQIEAAKAMFSIDKNDAEAITTLLKIMRQDRFDRATDAAEALAFAGPALLDDPTALFEAFTLEAARERVDSIFTACEVRCVPLMLEWLGAEQIPDWLRHEIIKNLGRLREFPVGVTEPLLRIAVEEKGPIQWDTLRLLGSIGGFDAHKLAPLLDRGHLERLELAKALRGGTKTPRKTKELLFKLREDKIRPVRTAAYGSLCRLDVVDDAVIKFVIDELQMGNPQERSDATWMASLIAPSTNETITPLIKLLAYDGVIGAGFGGRHVCKDAIEPLVRIGRPAVPQLIEALKSENGETRALSARALGRINDPRAIHPLTELLNDTDARLQFSGCLSAYVQVREEALKALASIDLDSEAESLLPLFEELLEEDWSRRLAIRAIGNAGPRAERFASRFVKAEETRLHQIPGYVEQSIAEIDVEIARALTRLQPKGSIGLIGVKRLVKGAAQHGAWESYYMFSKTVNLIVELGERARPLIPMLKHLVDEEELFHATNRIQAAYALAAIDDDPKWKAMLERWASTPLFAPDAMPRLDDLKKLRVAE